MKKIFVLLIAILMAGAVGCEPNTGTMEGKEAVENDTIDPREGKGEGEIGPEEIGGYEHNQ